MLKGADLDALSDDPDDLEQDLQALAGPAAGPNGGQIYIDGFTGGRLPPKESIREIRINQNPFSAEYDRLGFGRIEILTKPGTDKFRGQVMFNISDGEFNSRNPFLTPTSGSSFEMPDFQTRQYGGNLSGPLSKKASFFLDFDRREIDDSAVIDARIVNPATFAEEPYSTAGPTPQRRTTFSPRVDYALTPNNTLMARYTYMDNSLPDYGIGNFVLPDRAYARHMTEQTGQLTETAVLNAKWINETRFQVINDSTNQNGNLLPVLNVAGSFSDGGSGIGLSSNFQRHYELQNYTSTTKGTHSIKFGVRIRSIQESDSIENNFGGTWSFSGANNLTSLDAYRITLQGLQQGLSFAQIQAMGGGPSQFTIGTGVPLATVNQVDVGAFFQDDWRIKPNFTLSLGGRYETQTNIHDWTDFAPRIGFAWAPHGGAAGGPFSRPKMVIRGGVGVFYDRIAETVTLQENHFMAGQESLLTSNPALLAEYFPLLASYNPATGLTFANLANPAANSPAAAFLSQLTQSSTIASQVDKNIHAPYVAQSAIGIERQLASNTSLAVTYTNTRGVHQLLERDINAPLPGSYILGQPNTGVRPHGNIGDVYNYESTGILNQNQLIINVNTRIGSKVSLFGGYFLSHALSNVPGGLPANDYDLSDEYGRANFDVRNRAVAAGTMTTKWDIRLSPFIILASGAPFNIVSPLLDGNGAYDLRPAFAPAGAAGTDIVNTRFGTFDIDPYLPDGSLKPGENIIPRNYGQSPGSVTVNLRLSRTWSFGPERGTNAASSGGGGGFGGPGGGPRMGGGGGPRGGMGGMRMGGGGGPDASNSTRRYSLTASINARNLLNHTNYGPINGMLGSPTFGTSTSLAGGFGAETSPLNNRRLEWQLRFAF